MLIANGILLELGQRECPGGSLAIGPRETVMVVAVSPEEARSASEHLYRKVEVHSEHVAMSTQFPPSATCSVKAALPSSPHTVVSTSLLRSVEKCGGPLMDIHAADASKKWKLRSSSSTW